VCADGGLPFFFNEEKRWNRFDFVVTLATVAEVATTMLVDDSTLGQGAKLLRAIRVVRLLRILRLVSFFRELRAMVYSIIAVMQSLFWTVVLLLLILYVFALQFTQGAVDYLSETGGWQSEDALVVAIRDDFGSLSATIFSLYLAMTGGQGWGEYIPQLTDMHWSYVVIFVGFITFVILAVLNIVTGIVVETAISKAQGEKDSMIHEAMQKKKESLEEVEQLFNEIDLDGSGSVTRAELEEFLKDERMQAYLIALELEPSETMQLFEVLDVDGGGQVDIREFADGVMRFKGDAKSLEVAALKKMVLQQQGAQRAWMEKKFAHFEEQFQFACTGLPRFPSFGAGFDVAATTRDEKRDFFPMLQATERDRPAGGWACSG